MPADGISQKAAIFTAFVDGASPNTAFCSSYQVFANCTSIAICSAHNKCSRMGTRLAAGLPLTWRSAGIYCTAHPTSTPSTENQQQCVNTLIHCTFVSPATEASMTANCTPSVRCPLILPLGDGCRSLKALKGRRKAGCGHHHFQALSKDPNGRYTTL